jgi:hypothetical protein
MRCMSRNRASAYTGQKRYQNVSVLIRRFGAPSKGRTRRARVWRNAVILTDNETKVDLLNNEAIATTIVELLLSRPEHPVTIGVHGDWGAGKSSILEMIEAAMDGKEDVLCLKFNGWRFQGFEDAKIALIEGIVTGLIEKRPILRKATDKLKNIFDRINWLKLAKKGGGLALTVLTGVPSPELITTLVEKLEGLAADPASLATKENLAALAEGAKDVLEPKGEGKHVPTEVAEFRKAFNDLLDAANIKQLVVLIDDLDRCLPDTAIETLEAVRLFVFTSRTAFVVAADEAMIEYSVRKHFPELPDTTGPRDYARNYLEKLIQVPFRIPALGINETRTYVTLLLIGARLEEGDEDYGALIGIARQRLKRPWQTAPLDAASIRDIFKQRTALVQDALTLSDQIGPILAQGTQGNPRQIKRFLNALLLRQRIAGARGFADLIKLPILGKLMLAERFQPTFFQQVAFSAASDEQGRCRPLADLEQVALEEQGNASDGKAKRKRVKPAEAKKADDEEDASARNPMAAAWLTSEAILSWARVQPPLADEDLRPYLFIAKDRRDYFGGVSVLGQLSALADQLMGSRLIVQGLGPRLRELKLPEAAKVFEVLRTRIMSGDDFTTAPPGIEGMTVLVKAHPDLQESLLGFLEALPHAKLGGWVVAGWREVIQEGYQARFDELLRSWEASDNLSLRTVAAGVLRTAKRR